MGPGGHEEIRQDWDEISAAELDQGGHDQFSDRSEVFAVGGS